MKRSKDVLEQLALGVDDIINEFGWLGFSAPEDSPTRDSTSAPNGEGEQQPLPGMPKPISDRAKEDDPGESKEEPEEDEDYDESQTFEREDIEIGIDRLISRMIKTKLVAKEKVGHRPTLRRVFRVFYDQSDPILSLIANFERHIRGYFGMVDYDEMESAFDDIVKVRDAINGELEAVNA